MNTLIKRRGRRGAVLVESVVVISFFVLCFLGVLYFREVYLAKLRVQRLARASAMAHAMGACKGVAGAGLEKDLPPAPLVAGEDPGTAEAFDTNGDDTAQQGLAKIERASSGSPLNKVTKITLTTSASAVTKANPQAKEEGFKTDIASTSFVTCGDPVADGQYEEIVPHITSLF
jgi:hypothetical protein